MDEVIDTLRNTVQNTDNIPSLDSCITLEKDTDPFLGAVSRENPVIIIRKSDVTINGRKVLLRRVYVRYHHAVDYRLIGWVVACDVDNCMICAVPFSFFTWKHHCRICGDIVCDSCSQGTVRIKEFREYGYVRACNHCYFGQDEMSIKIKLPEPLPKRNQLTFMQHKTEGETRLEAEAEETRLQAEAEEATRLAAEAEAERLRAEENTFCRGSPHAVIKTKNASGKKFFVNVCNHNSVPLGKVVVGEDCPHDIQDKSGEMCLGYDVCVNDACITDEKLKTDVYFQVIEHLNSTKSLQLDEVFKLPSIKGNFKGNHTPRFNMHQGVEVSSGNHDDIREASAPKADEKISEQITTQSIPGATESLNNSNVSVGNVEEYTSAVVGEESQAFIGVPFRVIKTKKSDGTKVFINMCHHLKVHGDSMIIGEGCPRNIPDKSGDLCMGYDVCVSTECATNDSLINETYFLAIDHLNKTVGAQLDQLFKLPKIKGNFKGDHSPRFLLGTTPSTMSSTGDLSGKLASASTQIDEPSSTESSASPERVLGWVKREEGTVMRRYRPKYFVLDNMELHCYDGPQDTPPYGHTSRGTLQLTPTTVLDTINGRKGKRLQSNQLYLSDISTGGELALEMENEEERDRWARCLQKHIDYSLIARSLGK